MRMRDTMPRMNGKPIFDGLSCAASGHRCDRGYLVPEPKRTALDMAIGAEQALIEWSDIETGDWRVMRAYRLRFERILASEESGLPPEPVMIVHRPVFDGDFAKRRLAEE